MNNLIKKVIGKDIGNFTIHDASYDAKIGEFTIVCEPFEINTIFDSKDVYYKNPRITKVYFERTDENVPSMHTIVFHGINDYEIDGKPDHMAYDSFKDLLFGYSAPSTMNNIFEIPTEEELKEVFLKNIMNYLLSSDKEKINKYGTAITILSMTSLLLKIFEEIGFHIDKDDLNNDIVIKLDSLMQRYLLEHPEYIKKIQKTNSKLNVLMNNSTSIKEPKQK